MPHTPFTRPPTDRRLRRREHEIGGCPELPVHERRGDARHAAGAGVPMGRAVCMDTLGLWVLRLGGELAGIDGRCCWETRDELTAAAARAGIPLSDIVIHTGRKS